MAIYVSYSVMEKETPEQKDIQSWDYTPCPFEEIQE